MRAYNSRKVCRQHRLFKGKQGKLGLVNKNGVKGVFKLLKIKGKYYVQSNSWHEFYNCLEQVERVLFGRKGKFYSITRYVEQIEQYYGKLSDLGLTRKDISKDRVNNCRTITDKLRGEINGRRFNNGI